MYLARMNYSLIITVRSFTEVQSLPAGTKGPEGNARKVKVSSETNPLAQLECRMTCDSSCGKPVRTKGPP